MDEVIIFQEDYEGCDITISLLNDIVKLYDTYNNHHASFKITDIEKYIELCRELQEYQEYDEEEDEYYDPDEIYITDHNDGFLLCGDWAVPWRFEYYIDAIQNANIPIYNFNNIVKLNSKDLKNKLKDYNTITLQYILNNIIKQKESQQA